MEGTPGTSLEVFHSDGKRLFSQTYMRPGADAVTIEHSFKLPEKAEMLRLRDKINIVFPEVQSIPLFTNKDGVFDIPNS